MDKISVVIPLYNKATHIKRAIESILYQTIPPMEVIVVDDGSEDGGGTLVKSINNKIVRLITQENRGVSAARNRGILMAKGELIALLDADDAWKPGFLEAIINLREEYRNAGAYATAFEIIRDTGRIFIPKIKSSFNGVSELSCESYLKYVLLNNFRHPINSSAIVIPQKVLTEIGGFPINDIIYEDIDTWLRILLKYPIAYDSNILATYFQNSQNRTMGFKYIKHEPSLSKTGRKALRSEYISLNTKYYLREYIARYQLDVAYFSLMAGERETALKLLKYSSGTKMFIKKWWKLRLISLIPGLERLIFTKILKQI